MWRSLVARFVRDEEAVGSNPATPTNGATDLGRSPLRHFWEGNIHSIHAGVICAAYANARHFPQAGVRVRRVAVGGQQKRTGV